MRPQHQDPDEAVRGARFLEAELTIGSHFGTFQLTDEAEEDPVHRLSEALARWDLPLDRFVAGWPGQVLQLPHGLGSPLPGPLEVTTATTTPTDFGEG